MIEAIPALKQVGLLAGVAAAVAAAIWLVLWSQGQNYTVLYGQLSERESGQVMDALTAAGIEYKLSPSGAVSVPEAKVQEARIRLASQGLPQSDAMGIEMIQKDSPLGSSSMMESARYQSVLETELARTIIKVQGVQSARVHLALPKALGVPARCAQGHRLRDAAALSRPAPRAGAGRAPSCTWSPRACRSSRASDVTLVDQAGTLLNSPDENSESAVSTRQLEYTHKLEESYQRRIVELLEPLVGAGPGAGDGHGGSRFHRHRGNARELRSAKDRGAQRADQQRDAQGRRRRRRHSRRAQQSAARAPPARR